MSSFSWIWTKINDEEEKVAFLKQTQPRIKINQHVLRRCIELKRNQESQKKIIRRQYN